ncbi:metallopeptidase family protein [Tepidamorphus sp. 3E244]|uniref:metallopeptidase family protein n=1 Tax=Tepidamorphus sp. 3E244 TaxID=3385498 RepID=UPI0038FC7050
MATLDRGNRWTNLAAPSLDDFEILAGEAYVRLPNNFRELSGAIVFRIADFPDDEVLEDLGLESAYDLLGLFQGIGMSEASSSPMTGQPPNQIWLYRRPILDYWAEYEDSLGDIITHVLVHEIGHHFGLSDSDMEHIEMAAAP